MSRPAKLKLDDIRIDGGTQVRLSIDTTKVDEYAKLMKDGEVFRAVDLFHDGATYWLADGFHRYHAALRNGEQTISALVRKGTLDDAIWWSLNANRLNGLPLSPADKKKAVQVAVAKWPEKSDGELARHIGCVRLTIARFRENLTCNKVTSRLGQDGRTINTENIGRKKTYDEKPPETEKSENAKIAEIIPLSLPPKIKPGLTDKTGKEVTGPGRSAFERLPEIAAMMGMLSSIRSTVKAAVEKGDELYSSLNLNQFLADVGCARTALKMAAPFAVCPYCAGKGCKACQKLGWVGKLIYDAAPKELKG